MEVLQSIHSASFVSMSNDIGSLSDGRLPYLIKERHLGLLLRRSNLVATAKQYLDFLSRDPNEVNLMAIETDEVSPIFLIETPPAILVRVAIGDYWVELRVGLAQVAVKFEHETPHKYAFNELLEVLVRYDACKRDLSVIVHVEAQLFDRRKRELVVQRGLLLLEDLFVDLIDELELFSMADSGLVQLRALN